MLVACICCTHMLHAYVARICWTHIKTAGLYLEEEDVDQQSGQLQPEGTCCRQCGSQVTQVCDTVMTVS